METQDKREDEELYVELLPGLAVKHDTAAAIVQWLDQPAARAFWRIVDRKAMRDALAKLLSPTSSMEEIRYAQGGRAGIRSVLDAVAYAPKAKPYRRSEIVARAEVDQTVVS